MIFARYLLSTAMALGVTFGVFYGMQSLVVQTDAALDKPQSGGVIDFVRVKRESLPEPKKRELPDKPRSVDEPPPPQMQMKSSEGGAAVGHLGGPPLGRSALPHGVAGERATQLPDRSR